ncbi:MAG TPA: DNA-binding response regulator [Microscillaceae bacterium]|nr:DNA-binding response regulator [Microscillaceae bacterium]
MNIKALIVDDEVLAREKMLSLLQLVNDVEVVGQCSNGLEVIQFLQQHTCDLIFLDIQMPEMTGFEVLQHLQLTELPYIVFVTAYDQYALQAFEVHALDYLLKPFDRDRLGQTLQRVRKQIAQDREISQQKKLLQLMQNLPPAKSYLERMVIKEAGKVFFVKTDEISCIEAAGNYLKLYTQNSHHLIRETMQSIMQKLDPQSFIRIHRSWIVNLEHIRSMEAYGNNEYVIYLTNSQIVHSGRSYYDQLKPLLQN